MNYEDVSLACIDVACNAYANAGLWGDLIKWKWLRVKVLQTGSTR